MAKVQVEREDGKITAITCVHVHGYTALRAAIAAKDRITVYTHDVISIPPSEAREFAKLLTEMVKE